MFSSTLKHITAYVCKINRLMALRTTTAAYSPKQMEQTCVVLKIQVVWDITQWRLVNSY